MKIGIFQDIHANLPAFETAIDFFRKKQCAKIYHVGDLIGIGPYPREVFDLAMATEELEFIMGNHDYWFAFGIPSPRPPLMSVEEEEHQRWNHQQIGEEKRDLAKSWKFVRQLDFGQGRRVTFLHYGYDEKLNWFKDYIKTPNSKNLDQLFSEFQSDLIFYGHHHEASDFTGNSRYVNLGSAGCFHRSEVRLGILEIFEDRMELNKFSIHYEDNGLMEAFEQRKVPARDFITKNFITRK